MTKLIALSELNKAEIVELSRMLLARKLMPEDRLGTLSPMVNAPLAQCVALVGDIPSLLAEWFPRLMEQFLNEMSDTDADPSLSDHLINLGNDADRRNLIRQYFLPFQAAEGFDVSSAQSIARAFGEVVAPPITSPDMGPLYPTRPEGAAIVLPLPFASSIFDQILIGRHSYIHLEALRRGLTMGQSSDAVVHALIDALRVLNEGAANVPPFHSRQLRYEEFAKSFAYTQMMELGFSREEMLAALSAWELIG